MFSVQLSKCEKLSVYFHASRVQQACVWERRRKKSFSTLPLSVQENRVRRGESAPRWSQWRVKEKPSSAAPFNWLCVFFSRWTALLVYRYLDYRQYRQRERVFCVTSATDVCFPMFTVGVGYVTWLATGSATATQDPHRLKFTRRALTQRDISTCHLRGVSTCCINICDLYFVFLYRHDRFESAGLRENQECKIMWNEKCKIIVIEYHQECRIIWDRISSARSLESGVQYQ